MVDKTLLYEDTDITLDAPYNLPLKHLFRDDLDVRIIKDGDKTIIRIRQK